MKVKRFEGNGFVSVIKEGFKRAWNKENIRLKGETNYTKRVCEPVKKIEYVYNSKGEFVGIDILDEEFDTREIIQNDATGESIVIIHHKGKKYKGVAKCHEEDWFDPQVGFTLANYRANVKMYNDLLKSFEKKVNEEEYNFWNRLFD